MSIRLHIVVEGQTEETFVNRVLAPEFFHEEIYFYTHLVTTRRDRGGLYRGGLGKYRQLQRDLVLWMKEDSNANSWFTTMVDFYALPSDFPGYAECQPLTKPQARVECLEDWMLQDIQSQLGDRPVSQRFIPFICLHEFEALLLTDVASFDCAFPDQPKHIEKLEDEVSKFGSPEDVNEGHETAPSKRILSRFPDYNKIDHGVLIAQRIGLTAMRGACPHFDRWLTRLLEAGRT